MKIKKDDDGIVSRIMRLNGKLRDLREVRLVKTSGEREERQLRSRPEGGKEVE